MKGFTLVELLAVIVILAVVALVTTPAILNVINDSRLEGAKDKAWGTIDAVKLAYAQAQAEGYDNTAAGSTGITVSGAVLTVSFATNPSFGTRAVSFSGDRPSAGSVKINTSTGVITAVGLKFSGNGDYTCTSSSDGTDMCCIAGTTAPTQVSQCGSKYKASDLAS